MLTTVYSGVLFGIGCSNLLKPVGPQLAGQFVLRVGFLLYFTYLATPVLPESQFLEFVCVAVYLLAIVELFRTVKPPIQLDHLFLNSCLLGLRDRSPQIHELRQDGLDSFAKIITSMFVGRLYNLCLNSVGLTLF